MTAGPWPSGSPCSSPPRSTRGSSPADSTTSRSPRALEAAALVAAARRAGGGAVVWAGSAALANEVADLFEPGAVSVVANPRPDARHEEPAALRARMVRAAPRGRDVREDETHLSSIAFPRAIGALAPARRACGSWASTSAPAPRFGRSAEPDGTVASRVHARGGLAGTVLAPGQRLASARLAGDAGEEAAVADLLQTLRARPATCRRRRRSCPPRRLRRACSWRPSSRRASPGPLDLVIGAGRTIAAAPHPAQAARMLLDGVRPVGVTQLAVDAAAVLGPLGSLPDDEIREGLALLGERSARPARDGGRVPRRRAGPRGDARHRASLRLADPGADRGPHRPAPRRLARARARRPRSSSSPRPASVSARRGARRASRQT